MGPSHRAAVLSKCYRNWIFGGKMAVEKNVWIKACPLLPHFFKFCPTTPPCSFCCLISLNEWLIEPHSISYVLLHYIMDLHMSSLDRLLPQRPCSLFYGTRCHVYWVLTHDMFFWGGFYYSLISHTQMKTYNTQRGKYTDTLIQIYVNTIYYVLKAAACIKLNE